MNLMLKILNFYQHPETCLRSKQKNVGLSDLFLVFVAPARFIHQEHVENHSPKYQMIFETTRRRHPQTRLYVFIVENPKRVV